MRDAQHITCCKALTVLDRKPRPSGTTRDAWALGRGQGHDRASLSRATAFWDMRLRGSWLGAAARARALGTTAPAFLVMLQSVEELLALKPEQARAEEAMLLKAIEAQLRSLWVFQSCLRFLSCFVEAADCTLLDPHPDIVADPVVHMPIQAPSG